MKRTFSFSRVVSLFVVVAGLSALLVACNKDLNDSPPPPASGVMVLNLAPDQDAIGLALSSNLLTSTPLSYTNFSGSYRRVYAGQHELSVYDFRRDSILAKGNFDFAVDKLFSVFVTGNKGVYTPVVVEDEVDSTASAEKAYVRYINAIPDSSAPRVNVTQGGTPVFDATASFRTVSPFVAVNEGSLDVSVNNNGNISASRTISLQKGRVYTALLIGDPAASDTTRKVQIRYIENGAVAQSENK